MQVLVRTSAHIYSPSKLKPATEANKLLLGVCEVIEASGRGEVQPVRKVVHTTYTHALVICVGLEKNLYLR